MATADIINAVGTILIPIILAVWATLQWRSDRNASTRQKEEEAKLSARQADMERERAERQRDTQLMEWGMRVIELMAELEGACRQAKAEAQLRTMDFSALAWRASALLDQGRLFFPNFPRPGTRRGYRPKLLDEVMRAFRIADHLAEQQHADRKVLRARLEEARTRFVTLLQDKTRLSLYPTDSQDAGVSSIPKNPMEWEVA